MSRKDYQAVAAAFRAQVLQWPHRGTHWQSLWALADKMCSIFSMDNERFDRARFMDAAGFNVEERQS